MRTRMTGLLGALTLTLGLVLSSLSTVAPAQAAIDRTWVPKNGASFNMPRGGAKARTKLIRQVIRGVKNAPKGSYIRFAIYSFDRRDVADALIKAHKRGVHVQVVLNDNWTSSQTRRLRKELGKKPRRKSFVVICEGSCRGGKGNLHMKVYAFSQTGAATKVIMSGSSNLTDRAVSLQWNDQITFNSTPGLYDAFIPLFNQLKFDKRVATRRVTYTNGAFDALFYKDSAGASAAADAGKVTTERFAKVPPPSKDPVLIRLKNVDCKAKPGYGSGGKTVIRIIMYGWNKERGKYLADQVASMKRAGCKIAVITSVAGGEVVRKLNAARIPLKSADYDYITNLVTEEETVNFYSHLKVMTLDGTYLGKGTRTIWTGSENWSGTSFLNDELILHLTGDGIYKKYITHFRMLWKRYTHAVGVHPDYLP